MFFSNAILIIVIFTKNKANRNRVHLNANKKNMIYDFLLKILLELYKVKIQRYYNNNILFL